MIIGCAATFQRKPGLGPACKALKPQPSGAPMKTDYSLAQKALHWASVLLIIGLGWTSRDVLASASPPPVVRFQCQSALACALCETYLTAL